MANRAYLYISSWIGLSPEAVHYQGELQHSKELGRIELKRVLSEADATALNKIRRRQYPGDKFFAHFRAGSEYDGFDSRDDLIKLALSVYKTHYPDTHILILGRSSICDPQEIVDHPDKEVMERANKLYEEFERYEGWQYRKNYPVVKPIAAEWDKLLKQA